MPKVSVNFDYEAGPVEVEPWAAPFHIQSVEEPSA
jgi:hypothetical protein